MFAISQLPMNTDNILEMVKYSKCDGLAVAPSVLADIASSDDTLNGIRNIKIIMTGGGKRPCAPNYRAVC